MSIDTNAPTVLLNTVMIKQPRIIIAFAALTLLFGCEEQSKEPEPVKPWEKYEAFGGNFTVNSKDIRITGNVSEIDYYSNGTDLYSYNGITGQLPTIPFEFYTLNVYIPTIPANYNVVVSNYGGSIEHNQGKVRIDGDPSSTFAGTYKQNGVDYSIFRIIVRDVNTVANASSFKKMIFVYRVTYKDLSGAEKFSGVVNMEVGI